MAENISISHSIVSEKNLDATLERFLNTGYKIIAICHVQPSSYLVVVGYDKEDEDEDEEEDNDNNEDDNYNNYENNEDEMELDIIDFEAYQLGRAGDGSKTVQEILAELGEDPIVDD